MKKFFDKILVFLRLKKKHDWYNGPDELRDQFRHAINGAIHELAMDGIRVKFKWNDWTMTFRYIDGVAGTVQGNRPWYRHSFFPGARVLGHYDPATQIIYAPRGFQPQTDIHEVVHYLCDKNNTHRTESQNHTLAIFKRLR